jgi:hypothetical protein
VYNVIATPLLGKTSIVVVKDVSSQVVTMWKQLLPRMGYKDIQVVENN